MAHSSSSSSTEAAGRSRIKCRCGLPALFLTSRTDLHPARRFFRCRFYEQVGDCRFFEWFDPDMPSYQKGVFLSIKGEKEFLEQQLILKNEVEGLLNQKLTIATSRIDELNLVVTNLGKQVEEMNNMKLQLLEKNKNLKSKLKTANLGNKFLIVLICLQICVLAWVIRDGGRGILKSQKFYLLPHM